MITEIEEDRLLVISDLHLGNPYCKIRNELTEFYSYAESQGFSVCINGDGFDFAQYSLKRLARQVPRMFRATARLATNGLNVYYIIGNHDIVLEHFYESLGNVNVLPFLNVWSGGKLIRIEHGHLYDPIYANHSVMHNASTRAFGLLLKLYPEAYRLQMWAERALSGIRGNTKHTGIPGEPIEFREMATSLTRRGFDSIIFGHTHHAGTIDLDGGKQYFNTGSWLVRPDYLEIDNGKISLKTWGNHH